ncbi:hypothetical protein AMELA_G00225030, partial [Ameiurus melas]
CRRKWSVINTQVRASSSGWRIQVLQNTPPLQMPLGVLCLVGMKTCTHTSHLQSIPTFFGIGIVR